MESVWAIRVLFKRFHDAFPLGFSSKELNDEDSTFSHVDHGDIELVVQYEKIVLRVKRRKFGNRVKASQIDISGRVLFPESFLVNLTEDIVVDLKVYREIFGQ